MAEKPSKSRRTGFDEEARNQAQEAEKRAREMGAVPGKYVDADYMEGGPVEAARRRAEAVGDVDHALDTAKTRSERNASGETGQGPEPRGDRTPR